MKHDGEIGKQYRSYRDGKWGEWKYLGNFRAVHHPFPDSFTQYYIVKQVASGTKKDGQWNIKKSLKFTKQTGEIEFIERMDR